MCPESSVQSIFRLQAKYYQDLLQIHPGPDQDKALIEDEWMKEQMNT